MELGHFDGRFLVQKRKAIAIVAIAEEWNVKHRPYPNYKYFHI